jgi:hypothetical protein
MVLVGTLGLTAAERTLIHFFARAVVVPDIFHDILGLAPNHMPVVWGLVTTSVRGARDTAKMGASAVVVRGNQRMDKRDYLRIAVSLLLY